MNHVKIILVGDADTGKTTIANVFSRGTINPNVTSTIGSSYFCRTLNAHSDKAIKCEIWDTAGSERYRSLITIYLRNTDIALLVFDLNNLQSFENIVKWYEIVKFNQNDQSIEFILIGNKSVLSRCVSDIQIKELALKYNLTYYQLSCYDQDAHNKVTDIILNATKNVSKLTIAQEVVSLKKRTKFCCY